MGLDSGVIIKGKTEKGWKYLRDNWSYNRETYASEEEYDFGYWRKCWNIRARVQDKIESFQDGDYTYMTLSDLKVFKDDVLKYFLNEENWIYKGEYSQVFTWVEELPSIANSIRDIHLFLEDIEYSEEELTDEDFEIKFYDSY